jgi:YHS domain-containing protein/thiol-disulfide isomerase/thioredoxin
LVLLHFWSPNCGPCRKLEGTVFPSPKVGAGIEKNYVPVKINAAASSAMVYAFKVDRVPQDLILTPQGNVLASYTSPTTEGDYLAKLNEVLAKFGQKGIKPADSAGPRQVNAAYAALQESQIKSKPSQVGYPIAQASASSTTPATSTLATTTLNSPPASQPSQSVDRYALPARQGGSSQKPEVPSNAMPSSYRNPYLASQVQSSGVAHTSAPKADPSRSITATHRVQSSTTSNVAQPAMAATTKVSTVAAKTPSSIVQLPTGSPPLGFEGYCPVSLKFDKKWVRGNVQFGAIHRGRTYLFVGDQQRQQFLANPDAYGPVFSGMDPVALLDNKQAFEGSRKYGFEYRGVFYLFSSPETMQKFASKPDHYAAGVRQAMTQHDGVSGVLRR